MKENIMDHLYEYKERAERAMEIGSAIWALLEMPYQMMRKAKTRDEETVARDHAADQVIIIRPLVEHLREYLEASHRKARSGSSIVFRTKS